jgi:predicted DNA binding protein
MKHVRVRISADGREAEIHPMYGVMSNAPFVERATALQWNLGEEGFGILHYVVGDASRFEDRVREVPEVLDYDIELIEEGRFYIYIRDSSTDGLRELFRPIRRGGLVVVPPVRYHEDGTTTLSLFGPDEEIQASIEAVPDPITVQVDTVGGLEHAVGGAETVLSPRQREAAVAALELGYYEIPREASHEDVAHAMDCAPSTAAEHLRKAEAKVLRTVLGTR